MLWCWRPPEVCLLKVLAERLELPALRLRPSLTKLYRKKISGLAAALSGPAARLQAIEALCGLISGIGLIPDSLRGGGMLLC